MKITLEKIFLAQLKKQNYNKQDLFTLQINPDMLKIMATQLNLNFRESDSIESNLCFANHSEVRAEFRTTFNKMDIIRYASSFIIKDTFYLENEEVPLPENALKFWEAVNFPEVDSQK